MIRRSRHNRRAPHFLPLEGLEPRINLSVALPTQAGPTPPQNVVRYRTDALSGQQAAASYGKTYTNAKFADAQNYFNHFHDNYTPYQPADTTTSPPPTTPTTPSTPTPEPTTPVSDPTPVTPPATPPATTTPIGFSQSTLGNFTRLTLTGTAGNDAIVVTQSNNTLWITANGNTTSFPATFTEIAIYGHAGDDTITVQSSVTLTTLVYPGTGTNTVTDLSPAHNFIVSLGAGQDTLTGNGSSTDFWADPADNITNGTPATTHRVATFYQPFATDPSKAIPTTLNGQNLPEPLDAGATTRTPASLWGNGPTMTDMNQGMVSDCYFLADLQSLAYKQAGLLQDSAVDLGDGTYAVQFKRSGTYYYVRVDGDLPASGYAYAHPLNGGAIWAAIMEKAYALFRNSAATYSSLNWGWVGAAFNDLGVANTSFNTASVGIFTTLAAALANNKAAAAISNGSIPAGIPIIASHAYSIVATSVEAGTPYVTLRNPWGIDGAGNDGNSGDGLLKITLAQFQSAFAAGCIQS